MIFGYGMYILVCPVPTTTLMCWEASHLFANIAQGIAPLAYYVIQGKEYNMSYYLVDGIFPKWSTLVQTIHDPWGPKRKLFAMKQEAYRKDVECAFRVLQS